MRYTLLFAASLALSFAACRREETTTDATTGTTERARAAEPSIEPPLRGVPQRIVPTTTAAAEYLAALIDPRRIAALPEQVDDFAVRDFHAAPFGSMPRFAKYAAEPVLAFEPDLVVTMSWQSQDTTTVLRRAHVPVLVMRSGEDYEAVRATLASLGRLLDAEQRAAEITQGLDVRAAALRARASQRPQRRALVYSNNGSGGWAGGAHTTSGALLDLTGLVNAGAEDGIVEHKPIDMERVLHIAPDLFVCGAPTRAEAGSPTRDVLRASKPLAQLDAVRDDKIAVIPSVLLSADSPAILDAAEALERELLRLFPEPK